MTMIFTILSIPYICTHFYRTRFIVLRSVYIKLSNCIFLHIFFLFKRVAYYMLIFEILENHSSRNNYLLMYKIKLYFIQYNKTK